MSIDEQKWDGRGKGTRLGNAIFVKMIGLVGLAPAYLLLCIVASIYAVFDKPGHVGINAFRRHSGMKPAGFFGRWLHYHSYGQILVDRVAFLVGKGKFKYSFVNQDLAAELLSEGKGLILLSAHLGGWDIASNILGPNITATINAVMLDNERDDIKSLLADVDSRRKFNIIAMNRQDPLATTVPLVNALRAGEIVCFHGDRVVAGAPFLPIDLFGEPIRMPIGPFQIAALTGAPILPVFCVKPGLFKYHMEGFEPIRLDGIPRSERQAGIENAMKKFAGYTERIAARFPYQWANFFDLWDGVQGRG